MSKLCEVRYQQARGALGTAVLAVVLQHHLRAQPDPAGIADAFGWTLAFTVLAFIPAALLPTGRSETEPEPTRAAPAPAQRADLLHCWARAARARTPLR